VKKALLAAAGVIFVVLGIVGLALPFLQGVLFIVIGVVLLSLVSSRIRMWSEKHTRRYPGAHKVVERIQKWIIHIVGPTH
jgi:uncharacterized protein